MRLALDTIKYKNHIEADQLRNGTSFFIIL